MLDDDEFVDSEVGETYSVLSIGEQAISTPVLESSVSVDTDRAYVSHEVEETTVVCE